MGSTRVASKFAAPPGRPPPAGGCAERNAYWGVQLAQLYRAAADFESISGNSRVQKKSRLCLTADIRHREFGVLRIVLSECESSSCDPSLEPLRFSNLRHGRSRVQAAGISAALELNHGR